MQIWLFFEAGCGGDSLANLLEHCSNVCTLDGVDPYWRIHRIVDGEVKFYAPSPDKETCFRSSPLHPFCTDRNSLRSEYIDLVANDQHCVVTSHDLTLDYLEKSHCLDILCKNQIKILLKNSIDTQTTTRSMTKNLLPHPVDPVNIDSRRFDLIVDIAEIATSWSNFEAVCNSLDLIPNRFKYAEFQDLCKGSKTYMKNNYNVEIYQSRIGVDSMHYDLIDVWQSTNSQS